jgi:hypothetical protein
MPVSNPISPQRQILHFVGLAVTALGFLSFMSVFVTAAFFSDRGEATMPQRAVGGFILMMIGTALMGLARGGAAGAGLFLDPKRARKDLEPWARLSGGLQKDALDEMGVNIPHIVDALTNRTTASGETFADRLRGLHALYKEGILSEEEYLREKQELLDKA